MEPSAKTVGSVTVTPVKSGHISRSSGFGENVNPNFTKSSPAVKSASMNSSLFMSPRAKIDGSVCVTPGKSSRISGSKTLEGSNFGENVNPNLTNSGRSGKSASRNLRNPSLLASPRNLMRERRFVVAKKKGGTKVCEKCKEKGVKKCLCVAYESLRASQETFFEKQCEAVDVKIETSKLDGDQNPSNGVGNEVDGDPSENVKTVEELEEEEESGLSSATFKRTRDKLLEEARDSVPEPGSGRVMHLVKAFEKLLSMRKKSNAGDTNGDGDEKESEDGSVGFYKQYMSSKRKVGNWALPGMQLPTDFESNSHESMSLFCPSDLFLTSEKLRLESRSSLGSSFGRSWLLALHHISGYGTFNAFLVLNCISTVL